MWVVIITNIISEIIQGNFKESERGWWFSCRNLHSEICILIVEYICYEMYERHLIAVKLKQVENRNLQVLTLYLELYVYSYISHECWKKAPMLFRWLLVGLISCFPLPKLLFLFYSSDIFSILTNFPINRIPVYTIFPYRNVRLL